MLFGRLPTAVAAGATGFLAGFLYHKLPIKHQQSPVMLPINHHQSLVKFAKPPTNDSASNPKSEGPLRQTTPFVDHPKTEKQEDVFTSIMKFGVPSYVTLSTRHDFVLSYDRRNKVPAWVMEHLTPDMIPTESSASRSNSKFFEDETVHRYFRASPSDYSGSGYDKGHLATASHHKYSQEALDDTFVLSNIAPQNPDFNRKTWESLEQRVRFLVKKCGSVYVCSGPLFKPRPKLIQPSGEHAKKYVKYEVIGENNVAVPTHFFKVIVCEDEDRQYDMESYIIPNQTPDRKSSLSTYLVPRKTIEKAAGFLIFNHLPDKSFRSINCESSVDDYKLDSQTLSRFI